MSQHSNPSNGRGSNTRRVRKRRRITEPVVVNDELDTETIDDPWLRLRYVVQRFSGPLLSFLIHVVLLLFLALFVYSQKDDSGILGVIAEITTPTEIIDRAPVDIAPIIDINTDVDENHSPIEAESTDNALSENINSPTISDSNTSESDGEVSPIENTAPIVPEQNIIVGGGLQGRQNGTRSSLASKHGGTAASEMAVENGLRWLANHQFPDGSWRLDFRSGPCDGRCSNPATRETTTAATGLSLMAFLGAGYTHKSGPYQQQVQAGLDYLVSRIRKSVFGGNLTEGTMYAQGIATIALSEAYALTRDRKLRGAVESCLEYIVTAQHSAGGWRYTPGEPGDTTVTGWQMMAMKSCELAGFDVPTATIKKARKFMRSVGDESSGQFGYKSKDPDPTSTAIGLLMQMYHGWTPEHRGVVAGSKFLIKQGPSKNNIYFNYYATLVLFHCRHEKWDVWNQQMREFLISTQSKSGHESGSWFFKERYGSVGGRLYTTAMSIMILEVYYRYLPLFDRETIATKR